VGGPTTQPRILRSTDTEDMEFVQSFDGEDDVPLAWRRHTFNMATAARHISTKVVPKPIIPTPLKINFTSEKSHQVVVIDSDWAVMYTDQQLHNEANFIASQNRFHVSLLIITHGSTLGQGAIAPKPRPCPKCDMKH